jgi:propionyl-CoA carboxylase alpha chain
MKTQINKVLIANRGEIAVRIMKTCRRMGISTVAVYSEADRRSLHVQMADESVFIGPAPARNSYLDIEKIIEAAKTTRADAIHPGYGFLSENDLFAKAVADANIIFIGPTSESIRLMGNKLSAKQLARTFNVPMVPGTESAITDPAEVNSIVKGIGFPVLIKAAAGGGGKGMRIVREESELMSQIERSMSEALSSFGDGSVFVEKYVASPRHIEVQVLADQHGNCLHLFERECSIQRRHQKIIEEAPSFILTDEKRKVMGHDAVQIARSCNYTGAGTVEFLMDEHGDHYFLEMNTRLQVEHPVTEMITDLDLVEQQIRIAEGYALTFTQDDLKINGHAVELRVYAENASAGFVPSTGRLTKYRTPVGAGIRVDDGYREGMEIPVHYDPMISKLIAHGQTRQEAILKLKEAIEHYDIRGVDTTLQFGKFAITHPAFRTGKFDTHFIEKYGDEFLNAHMQTEEIAAKFVAWLYQKKKQILSIPKMD